MRSLMVCVLRGTLSTALAAGAEAQEPAAVPAAKFPAPEQVVKLLATRLALSSDQKAAIAPIIADRQSQFKTLLADAGTARRARVHEAQSILTLSDARINAQLTTQQQTAYAALEQEMRQRLRQRMQGE